MLDLFNPMMSEIACRFLMGTNEKVEIEGMSLSEFVLTTKLALAKGRFDPLSTMLGGCFSNQKWYPAHWSGLRYLEVLHKFCWDLYQGRKR